MKEKSLMTNMSNPEQQLEEMQGPAQPGQQFMQFGGKVYLMPQDIADTIQYNGMVSNPGSFGQAFRNLVDVGVLTAAEAREILRIDELLTTVRGPQNQETGESAEN
jgi:hypothetical protein